MIHENLGGIRVSGEGGPPMMKNSLLDALKIHFQMFFILTLHAPTP